jgi:hypothetical protein
MDKSKTQPRRWPWVWRVLGLLLVALMCWGSYQAGRERGFREGEQVQLAKSQARLALAPVTVIRYDISDILSWKMDQLGRPPASRPYDGGMVDEIKRLSPEAASAKQWETPHVVLAGGTVEVTAHDAFHQRVLAFLDQ